MRVTEKDVAIMKHNVGQPLTLREQRLLGLRPPPRRGERVYPVLEKEPDDYSCLSHPSIAGKNGRVIMIKLMQDGSYWFTLERGCEPPKGDLS